MDFCYLTSQNEDEKYSKLYKTPTSKNNHNKLEIKNDDTRQEIRRQQLLVQQKKNRDAAFNEARAIMDVAMNAAVGEDEDGEEYEEEFQELEVKKALKRRLTMHENHWDGNDVEPSLKRKKKLRPYARKLMMSEWMHEVPKDFADLWFIVACPVGRRNLLVASQGKTITYDKYGKILNVFHSSLPGGSRRNKSIGHCTILDCISANNTYYVIDALAWGSQPLLDCEAGFRRFWLQSRYEDAYQFVFQQSGKPHPIELLPSACCNENLSTFLENLAVNLPVSLDGLLFFHQQAHYTSSTTPLVTWLKPFMIEEILGISVPEKFTEKPDGYIDFSHYMRTLKQIDKFERAADKEMDVQDECTINS